MYKAVQTVIASNNAAWSGFVAFENVFTKFNEKVNLLQEHAYNQSLALVGVSASKEAKRELVAKKAHAMSSSLSAYAVLVNNVELFNQMKISRWDILRGGRSRVLQLLDLIISKAEAHVNELSDFGVEQQTISELQTLRDELEVMLAAPRNAIIERKTLTHQIKVLTREIDMILKHQLDKLMIVLQEDHPDFFTVYRNARVIVDLKAKHGGSGSASENDESNARGYEE